MSFKQIVTGLQSGALTALPVAILVAIASLWPAYVLPAITGEPAAAVWLVLSYVMLGVMAAVFVRRFLLFRRLVRHEQEQVVREAIAAIEGEYQAGRDMVNRVLRINLAGIKTFETVPPSQP